MELDRKVKGMALRNCKVITKFRNSTVVDFGAVYPDGTTRLIARVEYPQDGQLDDSVEANKAIADALSKRIRKSVP